jgi:hypothetical protein
VAQTVSEAPHFRIRYGILFGPNFSGFLETEGVQVGLSGSAERELQSSRSVQ